jgi:two-component system sensor histidine kinase BarA
MRRPNSKSVAPSLPQNGNASKSLEKENAKLKAQNRKLHDLSEWRSASMAHLAHELRTPLTSILGFSEIMLSQEELTEVQRNFCERIQNSAHQLQQTLNDLSELSRTETPPKKR